MKMRILFIEDDDHLREVLLEAATMEGYLAIGVASAEAAIEQMEQQSFDIIVTDINLPGMSGLDLLQQCSHLPSMITIVITAHGTIDTAVEAMKRGASDFLVKPFALETLLGTMRVAKDRVKQKSTPGKEGFILHGILAESSEMRKLLEEVSTIAPFNTTVLITGETGTGKEMVARAIHQQSPREARPLVALNCAAVPEQLLEDELFGHVKGAFTGAQGAREGRFEQANTGTLFLDEIGDMSLPLQSKLLRVLQEREFERVGSSKPIRVAVRILAATHRNLEALVKA